MQFHVLSDESELGGFARLVHPFLEQGQIGMLCGREVAKFTVRTFLAGDVGIDGGQRGDGGIGGGGVGDEFAVVGKRDDGEVGNVYERVKRI